MKSSSAKYLLSSATALLITAGGTMPGAAQPARFAADRIASRPPGAALKQFTRDNRVQIVTAIQERPDIVVVRGATPGMIQVVAQQPTRPTAVQQTRPTTADPAPPVATDASDPSQLAGADAIGMAAVLVGPQAEFGLDALIH